MNIGVPQGSILGPLLFIIYINDIVNATNQLSFVLYADDTTVYTSSSNIDEAIVTMNQGLINIANWFDSNKLTLNVDKTQLMMLSRRDTFRPQTVVSLKGKQLERVRETKFLGVILDEQLNWKSHIKMITSKISKSCGIIYRIRRCLTNEAKKLLYYSLIHPYIAYCINVWSSTYQTHIRPMILGQKRVLRALFAYQRRAQTAQIFLTYEILPIDELIRYSASILAHKIINQTIAIDDFVIPNNIHYNLRGNGDLRLPTNTRTQTQLFVRTRLVKVWNSLPYNIRVTQNICTFKNRLKREMLAKLERDNT